MSDLIVEAINSEDSIILFNNIQISMENMVDEVYERPIGDKTETVVSYYSLKEFFKINHPSEYQETGGRLLVNKHVIFKDVVIDQLEIDEVEFKSLSVLNKSTGVRKIDLTNIKVGFLGVNQKDIESLKIFRANITNSSFINIQLARQIEINESSFLVRKDFINIPTIDKVYSNNRDQYRGNQHTIVANNVVSSSMYGNSIDDMKLLFNNTNQEESSVWMSANTIFTYDESYFDFMNISEVSFEDNLIIIDLPDADEVDQLVSSFNNYSYDYSTPIIINLHDVQELKLLRVKDTLAEKESSMCFFPLTITGTVNNLKMTECNIKSSLLFKQLEISDRLSIHQNKFLGMKALGFYECVLPELFIDVNWDQFGSNQLYTLTDLSEQDNPLGYSMEGAIYYFGHSLNEMNNIIGVRKLISYYSKFYRIFQENGDILSANKVYRQIQELYTKRFEYLARSEGGLRNQFKWRFNQLLKLYTDYGTNPTKALVISFYIIIMFSFFYFAYPSEWDLEHKERLLAIITRKSGTQKTGFIGLLGLLLINILNALTLSINSFVTLGFGAIPAKGIARYVCILQGFIGWFLLSIFSVALINQVIF